MKDIIKEGKRLILPESRIQIFGSFRVIADGCRKIIEYNDIMVKLRTDSNEVTIWGEGLSADDFGNGAIAVKGKIHSVEFE